MITIYATPSTFISSPLTPLHSVTTPDGVIFRSATPVQFLAIGVKTKQLTPVRMPVTHIDQGAMRSSCSPLAHSAVKPLFNSFLTLKKLYPNIL